MGDVGECQTSNKKDYDKEDDDAPAPALDEGDIALLKTYGLGPYTTAIKDVEKDITEAKEQVKELIGIKESDTGLSQPSQWDLVSDKQMMQEEQALQVARCTKIINAGQDDAKYVINVRQIAKFVVGLGEKSYARTYRALKQPKAPIEFVKADFCDPEVDVFYVDIVFAYATQYATDRGMFLTELSKKLLDLKSGAKVVTVDKRLQGSFHLIMTVFDPNGDLLASTGFL